MGAKKTPFIIPFAALLGLVLCFSKLTGQLGIDSAWPVALALSLYVSVATPFILFKCPHRSLTNLSVHNLSALAVVWLILLIAGVLRNACDQGQGFVIHLLGPLLSVLLMTALSYQLSKISSKRWLALSLCLGTLIAAILFAIAEFLFTPGVFSYGHFWGIYPGPLYDRTVHIDRAYLSFRAVTLGLIVILYGISKALPSLMLTGASALLTYFIAPYAHWRASDHIIQEHLAHHSSGRHCDLYFRPQTSRSLSKLFTQDCDFWLAQMSGSLRLRTLPRVKVYMFSSAHEKRRFVGASRTYVAKPWRKEVYLQQQGWPHPVLAHELAHVLLGAHHPHPLRIPFRDVQPALGLIEGSAEALSWQADEGYSPHQWAKVLVDEGRSPHMSHLLSLRFYRFPAERVYTATSSFVHFLIERFGPSKFRDFYRDANSQRVYALSITHLEQQWRAYLRNVKVDSRVTELARILFREQAIFDEHCARYVAGQLEKLRFLEHKGEIHRALKICERALRRVPDHQRLRLERLRLSSLKPDLERADRDFRWLMRQKDFPRAWESQAREWYFDAQWQSEHFRDASNGFAKMDFSSVGEDQLRRLEIKRWASALDPVASGALRDILLASRDASPRTLLAAFLLLKSPTEKSVGAYLIALRYLHRHDYWKAYRYLEQALDGQIPIESVRRYAHFAYLKTSLAIGDFLQARILIEQWNPQTEGERLTRNEWERRVAYFFNP